MEHNQPINEIISRAQAIGLSIRDLCEEAEVNFSTWWRWQKPDANPRLRDMQDAISRMDRVLSKRETAILQGLVERYPGEASDLIGREAKQ